MDYNNKTFDEFSAKISDFWRNTLNKASIERKNFKNINLPLARIKRLMKVEENVKMIAIEVPVLLSLVAEKFIEELTLRAWLRTNENKRKIITGIDISKTARTTSMYDFLVYIFPDEETAYYSNGFIEEQGE